MPRENYEFSSALGLTDGDDGQVVRPLDLGNFKWARALLYLNSCRESLEMVFNKQRTVPKAEDKLLRNPIK